MKLITYPTLVAQWHPIKNGNLTPTMVTAGSSKKVWWRCPVAIDHEWEATICERVRGRGCPCCRGLKVVQSNCLSTTHPELGKQWSTKNGDLTPEMVTGGSGKKVWWKCLKNHEWEATVDKRTSGRGCPYCSNKKVNISNCLEVTHPHLAAQWHPHNNGALSPRDVVVGSAKKFWWKCPVANNHEWEAVIKDRKTDGCPYCSNKKVVVANSLKTTHPHLSAQWHPNKNGHYTPEMVVAGCVKKFWWKCLVIEEHEWEATVNNRTNKGSNCPYCNESKGEKFVFEYLLKNNIKHEREVSYKTCKNKRTLRFDFEIQHNGRRALIEYQGMQHYVPVGFGGSNPENNFKAVKISDKIKKEWCECNKIPLLTIPYWEYNNIGKIIDEFLTGI